MTIGMIVMLACWFLFGGFVGFLAAGLMSTSKLSQQKMDILTAADEREGILPYITEVENPRRAVPEASDTITCGYYPEVGVFEDEDGNVFSEEELEDGPLPVAFIRRWIADSPNVPQIQFTSSSGQTWVININRGSHVSAVDQPQGN